MCATSKTPSFHVAHVVHGPSQVWNLSLLGRALPVNGINQAYISYVLLFSFRSRYAALHSSISSFTLGFIHRTSQYLHYALHLRARYRSPSYDSVKISAFRTPLPLVIVAARPPSPSLSRFTLPLFSPLYVECLYINSIAWPRQREAIEPHFISFCLCHRSSCWSRVLSHHRFKPSLSPVLGFSGSRPRSSFLFLLSELTS